MSILIIRLLVMPLIAVLTSISCSSQPYKCPSSCRSNSGYCIVYCGPEASDHHTYFSTFLEEPSQAIELDPLDGAAYLSRGMHYLVMGQIQGYVEDNHRALEDLEKIIELDPETRKSTV